MARERPEPTLPTPDVVALHLSASRRRILEVVRDCGPRTDEGIADCWMRQDEMEHGGVAGCRAWWPG